MSPNIPERSSGPVWDKSISLGNVLTIVAMAASMFLGYGKLDTRISVLESSDAERKAAMITEANAQNLQRSEVRQDLREIRQRLDALKDAVADSKKK